MPTNSVQMIRRVLTLLMLMVMMMMHLQKLWDVVDDREEDDGDNVEETVENLSSEFEKENLLSNFKTYINGSDRIKAKLGYFFQDQTPCRDSRKMTCMFLPHK